MIDPTKITNYDQSDCELEEFILFSVAVAGKTATIVAKQLDNFLLNNPGKTPFDKVRKLIKSGKLKKALQKARLGKYGILVKAYSQVVNLNLRTCSVDDLEQVCGIGPKTARFFLIHSRPNMQLAALDTHILKFLKEQGYDVPDHTPTGKKYYSLEQSFIFEAKKRNKPIAEFDLAIWNYYSKHGNSETNPA